MPKDLPHVIPNETQLERINHLYPQYRRLLRYQGYYENPFAVSNVQVEYDVVKAVPLTEETISGLHNFNVIGYENGILSGKSVSADFNFLVVGAEGVDLSEVVGVRFDLDVPKGKTLQVFFSTMEDKVLSETKSVKLAIEKDGLQKVTIDFTTKNASWKGTLKQLRIDPCNGSDVEFKVGNVEFQAVEDKKDIYSLVNANITGNVSFAENALVFYWGYDSSKDTYNLVNYSDVIDTFVADNRYSAINYVVMNNPEEDEADVVLFVLAYEDSSDESFTVPCTIEKIRVFIAENDDLDDIPADNINIEMKVKNNSHANNTLFLLCTYDVNGVLLNTYCKVSEAGIGEYDTLTQPVNNTEGKITFIKAFVFDTGSALSPVAESITK